MNLKVVARTALRSSLAGTILHLLVFGIKGSKFRVQDLWFRVVGSVLVLVVCLAFLFFFKFQGAGFKV